MPFIPVPRTVQINMRGTLQGERVESTLYFQKSSTVNPADVTGLCILVAEWWNDELRTNQSNTFASTEFAGVDLSEEDGAVGVSLGYAGELGLITSPALPNNCTVCISFRTGRAGRSFRGRNYFAGLTEAQVSGNSIIDVNAGYIVANYEALLSGAIGAPWTWVVVSRYSNGAPRSEGIATPVLTCGMTDLVIDSQRRRLPGRGV